MKKTLLLLASAALLLVGCQKEQIAKKNDGDGMQTVSFTVGVESATTKAVLDGDGRAAKINHWIMQVLDSDSIVYNRQELDGTTGLTQTFNVPLIKGQTYQVLFWADHVTYVDGGNDIKHYVTDDLTKVKLVDATTYVANLDERDAFYAVVPDFSTTVATEQQVTLKRPFAQLNVVFTDLKKLYETMGSNDDEYGKFIPTTFVAKAKVPTTFNVLTQAAGAPTETALEMKAANCYNPSGVEGQDNYTTHKEKATLYMDYILASAGSNDVVDIDFSFVSYGVPIAHSFTAIPFQRNYRTNILGDLMSANAKWTVTVDPDWDSLEDGSKDYNVYYYEANSIQDAQKYIENNDEQKAKTVDLSKYTVNVGDFDPNSEDKTIKFELRTTSPADMVNFTLPTIPQEVIEAGCSGWKITHESGYPTQNVGVNAPEGTKVEIDAPNSHVTVTGTSYAEIIASTSGTTLVIPEGVTVEELTIKEGGLEIHGTVSEVDVKGTTSNVFVRECENLSQTVYEALEGFIAPNYTGVQNTDGSWNITLEDFWPNFAAAEFSAIDPSAKTLTISTPAELALFAKTLNDGGSFANYTITINSTLDMSEHFWKPIKAYGCGNLSNAIIQGSGVIRNLRIKTAVTPAASETKLTYGAGFIGIMDGNLTVKDITFDNASIDVYNGSQVGVIVGMHYATLTFDNVKVQNSNVYSCTKTGLLLGQTDGKVLVRNCSVLNSKVNAAYSYALMVGLVNSNASIQMEGNNVSIESGAIYDYSRNSDGDFQNKVTIKGYEYGIENTDLWICGVQNALAEQRIEPIPTKNVDGITYDLRGTKFYYNGSVVDVMDPSTLFVGDGEDEYSTLSEAVAAAEDGDKIVLNKVPSDENVSIYGFERGLTIDFNGNIYAGYLLVGARYTTYIQDAAKANVTLMDSSANGGGGIKTSAGYCIYVRSGSLLTINSGKYVEHSETKGWQGVVDLKCSNAIVNGGTFLKEDTSNYNYVFHLDNNDTSTGCSVTINGGEFKASGAYATIITSDSSNKGLVHNVEINGGKMYTDDFHGWLTNVYGTVTVNDMDYETTNYYVFNIPDYTSSTEASGKVYVKGGKYDVKGEKNQTTMPINLVYGRENGWPQAGTSAIKVSGGTMNFNIGNFPNEIESGYTCIDNGDGTWTVVKAE